MQGLVTGALAGAALCWATFAYPPLVLVTGPLGLAQLRGALAGQGEPPSAQPALRAFVATALVLGLLLSILYLPAFAAGWATAAEYEADLTTPRDLAKLLHFFLSVEAIGGAVGFFALAATAIWSVLRPRQAGWAFALAVGGSLVWFAELRGPIVPYVSYPAMLSGLLLIYTGLAGGLTTWFVEDKTARRSLFAFAWLPALGAGIVFAMASDHAGPLNSGFALFTGTLAGVIGLGHALRQQVASAEHPMRKRLGVVGGLVPLALAAGLALHSWGAMYKGGPFSEQVAQVQSGPFAGLWTERSKALVADQTTALLRGLNIGPDERLLSLYDFPAGYLMAEARPGLPVSWAQEGFELEKMRPYYDANRRGGGYILLFRDRHYRPAFEAQVVRPELLVAQGPWFKLYREPPLPSAASLGESER